MKKNLVLLLLMAVLIAIPICILADSDLPFDGESWINRPLSDVAAILQEAGYSKSDTASEGQYVQYVRNNSPENVFVYYDKQSLNVSSVNLVYYHGSDQVQRIVDSYTVIYGDPSAIDNDTSQDLVWNDNGYEYTVSFSTNYDDAKSGKSPFFLCIGLSLFGEMETSDEGESSELITTDAEELEIGQSIELPFIEMSFSSFQILDKLVFSEKETGSLANSLSNSQPGAKYIAIRGIVENKYTQALDMKDGLRGKAYVDGYEYDIGFFSSSFQIDPLLKIHFYLYAQVPKELADSYEKCDFSFGFNDNFVTDYRPFDESKQYDHKYLISLPSAPAVTLEPTMAPTPRLTPTPRPTSTPVIDCEIKIISAKLKAKIIPELFVVFKNNSKTSVDRIDFDVMCYDAYGNLIKGYDHYEISSCFYDKKVLKKGQKTPSNHCWYFDGFDGIKKVKIAVTRYHKKDGPSVDIPEDQQKWEEFIFK